MIVARVPSARVVATGMMCLATGLGVAGCFESHGGFDISRLIKPHVPAADSPAAAMRLLEWTYNRRAIDPYREMFTADFQFHFAPTDSAGAPYRDVPWSRNDELISATHLFGGGGAQPPASSIRLTLDKSFFIEPSTTVSDPEGAWNKLIRTQVLLYFETADGNAVEVSGAASLYLVRGDAAMIPDDLKGSGFQADANRWYIRRWDDETTEGGWSALGWRPGVAHATHGPPVSKVQRTSSRTWGSIKALYRKSPVGNSGAGGG